MIPEHKSSSRLYIIIVAIVPLAILLYIPVRYIKGVVLLKDRANICFITYAPFGSSKYITVPLSKVRFSINLYVIILPLDFMIYK